MSSMNTLHKHEEGGSTLMLIMVIVLAVTTVIFGGLSIWAYTEYQSANNDVNGKIRVAVVEAEQAQREKLDKEFLEKEKIPNLKFTGPVELGRVTFDYPKNWSVYIDSDPTRGGDYEAYLHPTAVPMVSPSTQFALRVLIEEESYDDVVDSYNSKVNSGDLAYSTTSSKGVTGSRFDGNFSNNIRGSAVVFPIRDKTLTIRTDANTFKPDFDEIIKTVTFNQ